MTNERHLERDLPAILGDLAVGSYPDYIDGVLATTAQSRQRPAWTFPERWLPMAVVTRRPVLAPSVPWRTLGVLALIALLIAVTFAVYVGSQARLPAPFGLAGNGLIAFAEDGDIFTADPVTGATTAVVTGPDLDVEPVFSRDGASFAFERKVGGASGPGRLVVGRFDGRDPVVVTPEPLAGLNGYTFSPDGQEILFTLGTLANSTMWIAKVDGSDVRPLEARRNIIDTPSFRPPDGAEVVFASDAPIASGNGIYAVDVDGGQVRTIVEPSAGVGIGWLTVAPDGSRIAYSASTADTSRNTYRVHVRGVDGTGDSVLPMPPGATFEDAPAWSNDGKHLAVVRGYGLHNEDIALAVVPADGSGVGIETDRGLTGCCDTIYEWAPDDTTILVKPFDRSGQPLPHFLWDPLSGVTTPVPWASISDPTWQRLAP
jgi:dipeptidyl aminopeptidase/acylaminoacyl peptidase